MEQWPDSEVHRAEVTQPLARRRGTHTLGTVSCRQAVFLCYHSRKTGTQNTPAALRGMTLAADTDRHPNTASTTQDTNVMVLKREHYTKTPRSAGKVLLHMNNKHQ